VVAMGHHRLCPGHAAAFFMVPFANTGAAKGFGGVQQPVFLCLVWLLGGHLVTPCACSHQAVCLLLPNLCASRFPSPSFWPLP
jgi:hypothetical protein